MSFSLFTDPTMLPGNGPYELFDPGWLAALTGYQNFLSPTTHRPMPYGGLVIDVPDTVKIALAGDWGTNMAPATGSIRDLIISEDCDYTLHLGDTYYSGTCEENEAFAAMWPEGSRGSFNLTSNHDFYAGFTGYLQTLADPKFAAQANNPYFALRNHNWIIIALDTASHSQSFLCKDGFLDNRQLLWLNQLVKDSAPRGVILLSHHDGFNLEALDAECQNPRPRGILYKSLYGQVALPSDRPCFWYWGHVHCPIAYRYNNVRARCIGHGGIPYLPFPDFYKDFGDSLVTVEWVETDAARDGNPLRAPNGFAVLRMDGPTISEQFVDEYARSRWSNP